MIVQRIRVPFSVQPATAETGIHSTQWSRFTMAAAKKKRRSGINRRPNILMFMMDTQGAFNLSCYGYHRKTTPNYDAFAKEGVLFKNHFVTAPWTLPVHASISTGRYESGHGAGAQHEALEPGLPAMAGTLAKHGYNTAALCYNSWAASADEHNAMEGFQEIIPYNQPKYKVPKEYQFEGDEPIGDKNALKMVGMAKKWIEKNYINAKGRKKPFYLYMNNLLPHDPYHPPEPWRSQFMMEGVSYRKQLERRGNQVDSTIGTKALTFTEWQMQRGLYDASTACLDHRFGLLVQLLKDWGIYDDTLIIVIGDHGDSLGQHIHYSYHSQNGVYDAAVQTPLILRLPKVFSGGKRNDELVQCTDIYPMVLDLLKLKEPKARESIQGVSLLKALKGKTRDFALIEAQWPVHPMRRAWSFDETCDPRRYGQALKAARTKRHKYIWSSFGTDMLFDLKNDPDERWNIIDRKPELARKMRQQIEDMLMNQEQRCFPDFVRPRGGGSSSRDPYTIRRMKAWGLLRTPGVTPKWDGEE